jgi:hypothetical protein
MLVLIPYANFAPLLVCLSVTIASPLEADDITFNDLTDNVTATFKDKDRIIETSLGDETDIVKIFTPVAGAQPGSGPSKIFVAEDAAKTIVSDILEIEVQRTDANTPFYNVYFHSDVEGATLQTCAKVGGCEVVETGKVQTATTLDWVDEDGKVLGTDTIKFQSDVPEPSPVFLLAMVVVGVALLARRGQAESS